MGAIPVVGGSPILCSREGVVGRASSLYSSAPHLSVYSVTLTCPSAVYCRRLGQSQQLLLPAPSWVCLVTPPAPVAPW